MAAPHQESGSDPESFDASDFISSGSGEDPLDPSYRTLKIFTANGNHAEFSFDKDSNLKSNSLIHNWICKIDFRKTWRLSVN